MDEFNLLTEPWIPVLWRDGQAKRLSIEDTLRQAGEIREVRDSSPLVTFGIYRLLIAIVKWRYALPPATAEIATFPADALTKLKCPKVDKLFHFQFGHILFPRDGKADPDSSLEKKTPAYLTVEIPTKSYKAHFWHANNRTTRLCLACCIRGLWTLPPFCTGVGQGNESSINNAPPVYWLIHGDRLLDTLLLNMPMDGTTDDVPCWAPQTNASKIGPLEGMTWQPRRVALFPESGEQSSGQHCSRCGQFAIDSNPLVREIVFANRGSKKNNDSRLNEWEDPHLAGAFEKKKDRTQFIGLAAKTGPGEWCKRVQALFNPSLKDKRRQAPNINTFSAMPGTAGRYQAVAYMLCSDQADYEHWREERWPISTGMFQEPHRGAILAAAKQAESAIAYFMEEWPKRVWHARYPGRIPSRNVTKSWKTNAQAGAVRSAVNEFDARLERWFRRQLKVIADGGAPGGLAQLPDICREAGHAAVASVASSLSPSTFCLDRAKISRDLNSLVEDTAYKAERALRRPKKAKA